MASDRPSSLTSAQSSMREMSSGGIRIFICGSLPVAGRPRLLGVAFIDLLPHDWQQVDENTEYGIRETRQLLIEFIGGEPGKQLRDQFA